MDSIGSFKTQTEARIFASKHVGNEAITKNQDGSFGVHSLTKEENQALVNKDFSNISKDVVEFSVDIAGSKDKIIDRISSEKFKNIESARNAASEHSGHEAIGKNQDGSFSIFPFLDDKLSDVQKEDFSKFSQNTVEVSVQKSDTENKIIELPKVGKKAQVLLDNISNLLENIKENKTDRNNYGRGDELVDINNGIVDADCSGFVTSMLKKSGVGMERDTASGIGNTIRKPSNPFFNRVKQAQDIKPGDVITYSRIGGGITGHVMIVTGDPEPVKKNGKIVGYNLKIADSTSIKHTDDDRRGGSGAGSGIVSVNVDKNGNMTGFHWRSNLEWRNESSKVTVGRIKE